MLTSSLSSFFCPTRIHLGLGAHEQLGPVLRSRGCQRVFIALDRALQGSDFYRRIEAILAAQGIATAVFTDIEADPSDTTVERAFATCQAHGATAILAVGGGSTMDVAKAVGILATNGGRIHDYEGIEKFGTPPLLRIAIPTTAGTGSEVSGSCVISDTTRHLKMSIRHAALNPADVAILDPLALTTMPGHVAAHSGLDAFVHAFEAYISRQSNPMTDALSLQAVELIAANIRPFVADRSNLEAGLNMLCGSALAGMVFGQTGLGNVHCMARFVGAFYHLSHGLSNALCLPHVAAFNLPAVPGKYARVARAMGCHVDGLPTLQAARQAVASIRELCEDLGIPPRLRDAGVTAERFEEMAALCTQAHYNRWNPRHTTTAEFLELFHKAY
ncbi:alcohol dehydrogenase [Alicycliphilus denitrificans]|uniref:iron-containing alcohol dehydrogenase n=1 Tax=Alicycliphilus denitrificans TaxID=179636 RepID=UPI00095DF838|nr:iron-containing alcohol dehydrogenase [Alicycliphilus denitrificans]OJW85388.1 MAG: alcohol dehydrogenase [Alicycliphilus sp. 69-12]BCN36701.1 alcohol dehydrogenase [Alicycliphilus denitrificans]